MACGDVLSLADLQTAKKHQIFEAEVITGKVGGVAGGATIDTATNPVTGQTQQTLPSILADLGFDVQSWTSSTGGVLASANQVFLNDTPGSLGLGDYYAWGGPFPKTVPAGTDPALVGSGYIMRSSRFAGTQAREALRRSYAEAGYNLVAGSFEAGGTLGNANDVLLQERTGKAFSGPAGTVAAGTNPASGGFVDQSHSLSSISVKAFGGVGDDIKDDSDSVIAALAYAESIGGAEVRLGHGVFKITKKITVPKFVSLVGEGYSNSSGTAATIIKKYGNFAGVTVLDAAQLVNVSVEGAPGNGGDGVALLGGRGLLMNVSSHNHGNDGIKIGAYAGAANNTNLWRAINIISEGNGRHGLYASDDNGDFNCNAGTLIGYDANRNGSDGLRTRLAGNNQFFGVCCQVNSGYGLYQEGSSGNYFTAPYLEANTIGDAYLDAASRQNWIYGVRSLVNNGRITDLGTNNNILDRNSDFESIWQSMVHFGKGLSVQGGGSAGIWRLEKDANRNLLIDLLRTTASGYLHLGSDGKEIGLKFSDGNVLRKVKSLGQTVNFGTVAANSTKDVVSTITGLSTDYTLTANANFALPSGVVLSAYFDGTSSYYRIANLTSSAIAVSGPCRITAMKIGS